MVGAGRLQKEVRVWWEVWCLEQNGSVGDRKLMDIPEKLLFLFWNVPQETYTRSVCQDKVKKTQRESQVDNENRVDPTA